MGDPAKRPTVAHACSTAVREVKCRVPSKSSPGSAHEVTVVGRGVVVHCPCESFKHRGRCSHVEVTDQECGWHSMKSAVRQREEGVCPLCGSSTEQILCGGR